MVSAQTEGKGDFIMAETHKPPHPGVLVKEAMEGLGLSINAFAKKLDVAPSTIQRIVSEQIAISPEMAIRLSATIGGSAQLWLQRQSYYNLKNIEHHVDVSRLPQLRP